MATMGNDARVAPSASADGAGAAFRPGFFAVSGAVLTGACRARLASGDGVGRSLGRSRLVSGGVVPGRRTPASAGRGVASMVRLARLRSVNRFGVPALHVTPRAGPCGRAPQSPAPSCKLGLVMSPDAARDLQCLARNQVVRRRAWVTREDFLDLPCPPICRPAVWKPPSPRRDSTRCSSAMATTSASDGRCTPTPREFLGYNEPVSIVDFGFRMAYRAAYQMMRVYWRLARPTTQGALVAIWQNGEILLVRNSYLSYYCVPGGYIKRKETPVMTAVRELTEEVRILVAPEDLKLGLHETHTWEGKTDVVSIFDLDVKERPVFHVDNREVVDAEFFTPQYALELNLFPPLRHHIEARLAKSE